MPGPKSDCRRETQRSTGKANALDVRGFLLAGKQRVTLTDPLVSHEFREKIRAQVCARFHTVLGPGSDGYHEEHIHLDLAERRNDYRICQWNVLDVPLPLPRPPEADIAQAETEKKAVDEAAAAVCEEAIAFWCHCQKSVGTARDLYSSGGQPDRARLDAKTTLRSGDGKAQFPRYRPASPK